MGVSIVDYRDDGRITLFNPEARRTLGVPCPRSFDALTGRAPEVVAALRDVVVRDRVLIRLARDDRILELVAYATRFNASRITHARLAPRRRAELETRELEAWQQLTRVLTHEITNSVAPTSSRSWSPTGASRLPRPSAKVISAGELLGDVAMLLRTTAAERASRFP